MLIMEIIAAAIAAYLFGSISSAVIVCKLWGLPDPRTQGSKNPGATNVLRIGGKKPAMVTLLGDVLKGVIPVLIAKLLGLPSIIVAMCMFFAFFGHLFPLFFGFEGGKGVATLLGCLLALSLPVAFAWFCTWIIVVVVSRYVSVASMIASLCVPIYVYVYTHNEIYVITVALMSIILLMRHRLNIQKLFAGKENRMSF